MEVIEHGRVKSTSYMARDFNEVKNSIDAVLDKRLDPMGEVTELMKIRGFGIKLAKNSNRASTSWL
ncbi:MAG: hypothetical protein QXK88_09660 [Desulfurococcaceae archaeon]